jgi:hypothetical protein
MIKDFNSWLNESEWFSGDRWHYVDDALLDYFEVDLDDLVVLGKPYQSTLDARTGWMSESQPVLYQKVIKMVHDGELQFDPAEEAESPWFRKTGESEGGNKVHYYFFDNPFKVVVASIREQRWKLNNDVDRKKIIGQIYVTLETARMLANKYRGEIAGSRYGV